MGKTIVEAAMERVLDRKGFSYTAHIPERRRDMNEEDWHVFDELFETTDTIFDRVKYLCRVGMIDAGNGAAESSLDLIDEVLKAGEGDIEKVRENAINLKKKAPETESSSG